jgi:two-component system sensor histidine kinase/response regulator
MSTTGSESEEPRVPTTLSALVAEDNPVNEVVVVRMLEQREFRVDVASNGRQAVRMHESGDYDVIFMDCQLPELDGYAATAAMRVHEARDRHTPIIAMTASTLAGTRDRCLGAGMDDYLTKPVRPAELDAAISRALADAEP